MSQIPSRTSRRIATTSVAALLALGGTSVAVMTSAGAQTADPPVTVPDPGAPVSYTVTVTLPLIGDVTITVDASTGTIADVTVAPITGVVAGDPVIDGHHVSIDVTLADGTTTTVVLDAHVDDNGVEVEVEGPEHESGDDGDHSGPPAIEDRGDSAEHRQDDQGHRGHGEGIPASNVASAPNDSPADGSHGQGQESEHSGRR